MNDHLVNIQRLVDDELTTAERAEFLRWVDDQEPECWREIALRFVEAQEIRQVFAECEASPMTPSIDRPIKKSLGPARHWALTAAAVFAVGIGLGWFTGGWAEPNLPSTSVATANSDSAPHTGMSKEPDVPGSPRALGLAENVMRELDSRLTDHGVRATRRTVYVTRNLGERGQIIIPVSQFHSPSNLQ